MNKRFLAPETNPYGNHNNDDIIFKGNWFSHEKHLHASPSEYAITQKHILILFYQEN